MLGQTAQGQAAASSAAYEVTAPEEPNGVAGILGTLLQQNFESYPTRVAVARRLSGRAVAVRSADTNEVATIIFAGHAAQVCNGLEGRPAVLVKGTVDQIVEVTQLRMRGGGLLPVGFLTGRGLKVLREILLHRLVVKGLLVHPVVALRFISLVSIAA